jgi:hypothetical protein
MTSLARTQGFTKVARRKISDMSLHEDVIARLKKKVEELPSSSRKDHQDRLYKMIDYAIQRHDWYEDQRHRFLQLGLALLAFTTAAGTIVVANRDFLVCGALLGAVLGIASMLVTGVLLIWTYARGMSRQYPHRQFADIRSWYYRYNFAGKKFAYLDRDTVKGGVQVEEVARNFESFVSRWVDFACEDGRFLVEDLEQVFILQLLQGYRSASVVSMVRTVKVGTLFFAFSIVAFLFFQLR